MLQILMGDSASHQVGLVQLLAAAKAQRLPALGPAPAPPAELNTWCQQRHARVYKQSIGRH